METALGQLEIKTYIGAYLDREAIKACRLVNRDWNQAFDLFFWRHLICFGVKETPVRFAQMAPYIRSLNVNGYTLATVYKTKTLCRVKELSISHTSKVYSRSRNYSWLPGFLKRQCRNLESLDLGEGVSVLKNNAFWEALAVGCPNLRSVRVASGVELNPIFMRKLEQGTWPKMDSFMIYCRFFYQSLVPVISAMPIGIRELDASTGSFDMAALEIVRQKTLGFSTLRILKMSLSGRGFSAIGRVILEEARGLEELWVSDLESKDILESQQPWACVSTLRELRVGIQLSKRPKSRHDRMEMGEESRAVLERISTLTRLTSLDLAYEMRYSHYTRLELLLELGLDELKTLRQLKEVRLNECSRYMGQAEVEWILDHWPKANDLEIEVPGQMSEFELKPEVMARMEVRQIRIVDNSWFTTHHF